MQHIRTKNLVAAWAVSAATMLLPISASTAPPPTDCANADPNGVVSGVGGDFEIALDPQDPAGNLIFIANLASGNSSVVAARISGVTGQFLSQTLTTIANNFQGQTKVQGPEFVQRPSGELGVVYAGPGGVHAVFRGRIPASWNDLRYDLAGAPIGGSPTPLAGSSDGAYPAIMPLGQNTYGQYRGACQGICYGRFGSSVTTDALPLLTSMGLNPTSGYQSPRDGYVFFSACDADDACGLYEAQIDTDAGGFVAGTLQLLANVDEAASSLAAGVHPVTGTTVLFSDGGSRIIDVWEQPAAGGALTLIARVAANKHEHFRVEASATQLVLHYLSAALLTDGSFTIPVSANGTTLVAGENKKISTYGHGAELAWLPAANKWALFYRGAGNVATRCWVAP